MNATLEARPSPTGSDRYWRGIFTRNPDFCSWQAHKQLPVRHAVRDCLNEVPGLVRVLDFGIGSMGLYRALDDELMRRMRLLGISESQQHDAADSLLARYAIDIAIGPGLTPLAQVPAQSRDRIVCSYVLDYLTDQARREALAAFARVMADGAKLVVVLHHPYGRRAEKFRRSRAYWPEARTLYEHLRSGRHEQARATLHALELLLERAFARDDRYRRYLASYLNTARRFLSDFHGDRAVPEAALVACENAACAIDRERAMTCDALRPIENPATDLALPSGLTRCEVIECADPTDGAPMAYVLTAVRRGRRV
jgi:SAM-dependent methyltransferase